MKWIDKNGTIIGKEWIKINAVLVDAAARYSVRIVQKTLRRYQVNNFTIL